MRRSRQGSAFQGLEILSLRFDPIYTQNNVKFRTLSWRPNENFSRSNSGKVSLIMFKLGSQIDNPSGIAWHDSKVKKVKGQAHKVTSPIQLKIVMTQYWVVVSSSYLEANMRKTLNE